MHNGSDAFYHTCFCDHTYKKSDWTSYIDNLVVAVLLHKPISFI